MRLGTSSYQPLWTDSANLSMGLNPHKGIYPEPQNFMKPYGFQNADSLSSIRLVGVFTNYESAQAAIGCAPNRKLLGPAVAQ